MQPRDKLVPEHCSTGSARRMLRAVFGPEHGYSLVEAVVALALVAAVAVPAGGLVVRFVLDERIRHEIEALAVAQRHMEAALHESAYTSQTFEAEGGAWRVVRSVWHQGRSVTLTISVHRRRQEPTIVRLTTVRLP